MNPLTFFQDVTRFYNSGYFKGLCFLLFCRVEVIVCLSGLAAILFLSESPQVRIVAAFGIIVFAYIFFIAFTVEVLSPLYFGGFVHGRLITKEKSIRARYNIDEFELIPSDSKLRVVIPLVLPATGTVGKTYLLLVHPAAASIALPIIDEDERYMAFIGKFVSKDRAVELELELKTLRQISP